MKKKIIAGIAILGIAGITLAGCRSGAVRTGQAQQTYDPAATAQNTRDVTADSQTQVSQTETPATTDQQTQQVLPQEAQQAQQTVPQQVVPQQTAPATNQYTPPLADTGDIGLEQAKSIALAQVQGATAANIVSAKRDYEDDWGGYYEYDIDIVYNNYEYEFTIRASSGKITDYDVESIYD